MRSNAHSNRMIPFPPNIEQLVDAIYPPDRQAMALALAHIERPMFFVAAAAQLVYLCAAYYSGLGTRLRSALEIRTRRSWVAAAAFAALLVFGLSLVLLPLHWYAGFVVAHRFGLSAQSPAGWLRDWSASLVVDVLVTTLVATLFVLGVAKMGKRWPLAASAAALAMVAFGNYAYPVFVAPLFNEYRPLGDSQLARSVLALAKANGIDAAVVYEYDMSRQSTAANAFVSGIWHTQRIAIGDNLLRDLKPDEVLYVVAHEIGHYKLGHLLAGTLWGWAGMLCAIAIVATLGAVLVARRPDLARGLADPAALPLLAALLAAVSLAAQPLANGISRRIEHDADAFAAAHVPASDAGVRALARLASKGLSLVHPEPAAVWYFYTHPPVDERIVFAARSAGLIPPDKAGR